MPITVKCEGCGKTLKVKDELAGKRVRCPGCGQVVMAREQSKPPPTPAGGDAAGWPNDLDLS